MRNTKPSPQQVQEIEEIAQGWGKLLAEHAFPDGAGLDVSMAQMEDLIARATQALVRGAIQTMTQQQARVLGSHAPCPQCGIPRKLKCKPRPLLVRGGQAQLHEAVAHCWKCRRDFFPSASSFESRRTSVQPHHSLSHLADGGNHQFL